MAQLVRIVLLIVAAVLSGTAGLRAQAAERPQSPSADRSHVPPAERAPARPIALLFEVRGAIGPATSDFFVRTLASAASRNAAVVVVEMDTPGGLDSAMRDMIQAILASPVPVVTYVTPSGARAASAGTYLLYASHIAAMAPATNLGAATPVSIGGAPQPQRGAEQPEESGDAAPAPGSASERKAVNDAVAYIRGLAELRGRDADWAEAAVRQAESLSASEALARNVIDVIAADVPALLALIDGREVNVVTGPITIASENAVVERVEVDWRTQLLSAITNPNIAYLLLLVGIYGLLLEGYNPGAFVPGVVGAISLLLALFAFHVLSVNYAGLALIALGVVLIVAEAFVPSFGALGLGGIVAFVFGSIILMDSPIPGLRVARPLIGAVALVGALSLLATATYFVKARRRPVVTGADQLLRDSAVALADFEREGQVRVRGEIWQARTRVPVRTGQPLRIVRMHGLLLDVEPIDNPSP